MWIRVEDLAYIYAPGTPLARVALRGISTEIAPGERVGILGATGSGKSTLVQSLAGLLIPTVGRVLLDGTPAHERSANARVRRLQVGLAFQYPEQQFFAQTVYEEVAFGPGNLGLDRAQVAARVRWALEMVGLDSAGLEDRLPFTLSGGEMRRIALASVLAMQPRVLVLDEPTAGLDPRGRQELLARVQRWQEQTGATLILVSHAADQVARLAERVIILKEGQVIADGPTRPMLSDSTLLAQAGLDPPPSVLLLQRLREAGWTVRTDCMGVEEVVAEIAQAWRAQRSGGSHPDVLQPPFTGPRRESE